VGRGTASQANKCWLVVLTPLKNMKVSWDYYSQSIEKYKIFQTTNQSWFLNFLDHIKGPARWSVKRTSKDDQTGLV
jgi:hypothetical protein